MKCRREPCLNEVSVKLQNAGQVYCSKDCAPYGSLGDHSVSPSTPGRNLSYIPDPGERSRGSNGKTKSTDYSGRYDPKTGLPIKNVLTRTEVNLTMLETKSEFPNALRRSESPGLLSNVSPTREQTQPGETNSERERPGMTGMQETEMSTTGKSESVETDEIHLEDSLQVLRRLNVERYRSMNLIDESANVLLDCMRSAARRGGNPDTLRDFRDINAIANLGKQIASLAKVKLDAIKAAREK